MPEVKKLFRELWFELFKIILLDNFFNAAIVFLGIYFIISFFAWNVWIALLPAMIVFTGLVVYDIKHIRLKYVEDRNLPIQEILRTARDNLNESNVMLFALFEELVDKMKKVTSTSLVDFKLVSVKVGIIAALSFMIVLTAPFTVNLDKVNVPLDKFKIFFGGDTISIGDELDSVEFSDDRGLYGDKSVAVLGVNVYDLELGGGKTVYEEEESARDARNYDFPVEAFAAAESFSDEKQPKEMQLAKQYSLEIVRLR